MHRLFTCILSLVCFFAITSCSSDDPEPDIPQTANKTVFVFMPYTGDSNNLYSVLQTNLNDMATAIAEDKGKSSANLLVFISKDAQASHLIDFKYKNGECVRDTLKTYTSALYTTSEGIASILGDVKKYAPARKYATIVGSHGEGWLPKYSTTRFFGGLKYQIDVADFAQGIASAGMKMQFVLFDDCYMSGIEVAYDLRNASDWLIASTCEMMGYGMPYSKILKYLIADTPDYASLCTDFINFYKSYPLPYGTIGATNLTHIDEMTEMMKNINATHQLRDGSLNNVQDLDGKHFEPTVYFDFGSYVKHLCADDMATLAAFESLLTELVPYKGNTDKAYNYINSFSSYTWDLDEFSGLTISDPSENTIVEETKEQTAWWKATH